MRVGSMVVVFGETGVEPAKVSVWEWKKERKE